MCALTGGFTPYGSGGNVKLKYMDSPLGYVAAIDYKWVNFVGDRHFVPLDICIKTMYQVIAYLSFYPHAIRIWNMIPPHITAIENPIAFQAAIMNLPFPTPNHLNCL